MKKLLLALALASTTASAEFRDLGDGLAVTDALNNKHLTMYLLVAPRNNCEPVIGFWLNTNTSKENIGSESQIAYQLRVDSRTKWHADFLAEGYENGYDLWIIPKDEVLADMRRGNILRTKLMRNGAITRYSMAGFSQTLSKLQVQCTSDDEYFNRPAASNDSEYFL